MTAAGATMTAAQTTVMLGADVPRCAACAV